MSILCVYSWEKLANNWNKNYKYVLKIANSLAKNKLLILTKKSLPHCSNELIAISIIIFGETLKAPLQEQNINDAD